MKSSPSPPPAPNPQQTAAAQTQSNLQTAIANAALNRVNQQTPWGSITYTMGPVDPTTGVPTWSSHIELSPAQQQLLEQSQGLSSGRNSLAQQILQQQGGRITAPLNFASLHPMYDNGQAYAGAVNAPGSPSQAPLPPPLSSPSPSSGAPSGGLSGAQPMGMTPEQFQALIAQIGGQSQAAGTPASAPPSSSANQPAFGRFGDLRHFGGDTSQMPDYLAQQMTPFESSTGGDGGTVTNQTQMQRGGSLMDANGTPVFQIGDPATFAASYKGGGWGGLRQGATPHYDKDLGWVYNQSDFIPAAPTGLDAAMPAIMSAAAGGIGGMYAGALGGLGAAGNESAGLSMANPFAASGAPVTDLSTVAGAGVPVTDLSTAASQPSIWQTMGNNLAQGRGLLGLHPAVNNGASLLAQLLRRPASTTGGK